MIKNEHTEMVFDCRSDSALLERHRHCTHTTRTATNFESQAVIYKLAIQEK